jgi:uncharacterized protein (DUF302 family)
MTRRLRSSTAVINVTAACVSAIMITASHASAQQPTQRPMTNSPSVVTVVSATSFDSTLARLERAAVAKGLTVAAKIDHAAAAQRAGLTLPPTTLVIAGNPAAGTPLMQADPTMGVELPLRFLVWQGEDGKARVSYDPIKSIAARHNLTGRDELLSKMTGAIESIVSEATGQP